MLLSHTLAANLNRLMQARPSLGTNLKIVAASDRRLSNGKLGRIRLGGTTELETLSDLADVFGLQPWQLLITDLDPAAPPSLADTELFGKLKTLVDGHDRKSQIPVNRHRLDTKEELRIVVTPHERQQLLKTTSDDKRTQSFAAQQKSGGVSSTT